MSRPHAAMPTHVFRVRILGGFYAPPGAPGIWREVELAGDQTLAELGASIPAAFGFEDDHLWSFFLSGKPWDRASEYARLPDPPAGGRERGAGGLPVGDVPARQEFLFLFDYGDEWHFGVKLLRTGEVEPGARYPRVVASRGQAPPQYPDLDDEDDWDEDPLTHFPPVELAPLPQLQAAAAAAPTVRRLRILVGWLGEGRKLTAAGNFRLADAEELARLLGLGDPDQLAGLHVRSAQDIAGLALLVDWAKELRLARVHKGRLVPVKRHRRLLDEPLELLLQAAAVPLLMDLLSLLYVAKAPVTLGELAGHFWEEQHLGQLQGLGMVLLERRPWSPADPSLSPLAALTVQLTPLGTWWSNVLLRQAGAVVPVIGELAGADAATLIEAVSGYDERASRAELRAWCRERGAGAARELADYLRTAPDVEQRLLAFVGLSEAGPAAEAEVRSMLADPELRPLARLWLVGRGLEDAVGLDQASARVSMAETLASVLRDAGPAGLVEHLEQLGPPAEQVTVLADLWRARTPGAAAVLQAAGKAHPDHQVAKAARKAAFKLGSSGIR